MRQGLLLLAFVLTSFVGQAQKLIVNEVSQGPSGNGPNGTERAYVELLVVGTRTCTDSTLDLRGWIVDDNNGWVQTGSGTGIAPGALRFANVASWSKVPYGSIILLYNSFDKNASITLPDDLTDANHDYTYVVPASSNVMERHLTLPSPPSSASFTYPATGWAQGTPADAWSTVALANGGDAILTVSPASLNTAQFSLAYAIGSAATATVWLTDMPGGKNYFLMDANYTTAASWQQGDVVVNETPGLPNGGANTTWINDMRVQVTGATAGTLSSSNGTTLCTTGTTTLSSTVAGGTWTSSDPGIVSVTPGGVATAVSPGTATLTYTVGSGSCTATATINITVTPALAAGTVCCTGTLCIGETRGFTTTGTPGGVWSISSGFGVVSINPTTGVVTALSFGMATVTYTVGSGACTSMASVVIGVSGLPVVAPITGNNTVCVGNQVTLSSATAGGTWNVSDPAIASMTSSGASATLTGVTPGTVTVTYSVTTGGCTGTSTFNLTVLAGPNAGTVIGGPSVCVGATTTYGSNGQAGGTWSSGNTTVATVNPLTGVVTGVAAGSTTIIYTVGTAPCTATASAPITVNAPPPIQPTTGTNTICVGTTVQLTNPAVNGSGTWTASPTGIVTITPTLPAGGPTIINVTGIAPGVTTLTFTLTGPGGCTSSTPFTMTVNATPVVAPITGANTVCIGSTTTFSSATPGGTWTSANTTSAPISNTGVITGQGVGTFTITYTVGASGCSASVTKDISVTPLPVVGAITGNPNVCVGSTTQLNNASGVGVSTWTSSNTAVATVSGTGLVTGVSAGTSTITFTVLNAEGCTASATQVVTVSAPPVLGPIAGGTNLCSGTTANLANATPGGTWSSSNTAAATVSASGVVTGVATGSTTITYTVTNGGCTASVTTNINVTSVPNPGPIAGNTTLCIGNTSTLSGSLAGGTWSVVNPAVATVSGTGVLTAVAPGTTQVSYSVTNSGCTGVATATVTVADLNLQLTATPNPANAGAPVTFTSSANIPYTVTAWRPAGFFPNNTATTQTITASQSGEYYVVATAGGCIDTARITLVVNPVLNDLFVPNYFTPNGDGKNDILYIYGTSIAALDFRIFNQWGEAIFSSNDKGKGWDGTASGKMQPVGVYMYVAKVSLLNGEQKTLKGSINLIR